MRLDHVALTVSDHARSAALYEEHFGLTDHVHDDEHLLIVGSARGSLLALRQGDPPSALGEVHFGFRAADADAVRAARERFAQGGVREIEFQDDGRFVRVQVADPDGYRVEVYSF